jgi:hypothetical protein
MTSVTCSPIQILRTEQSEHNHEKEKQTLHSEKAGKILLDFLKHPHQKNVVKTKCHQDYSNLERLQILQQVSFHLPQFLKTLSLKL